MERGLAWSALAPLQLGWGGVGGGVNHGLLRIISQKIIRRAPTRAQQAAPLHANYQIRLRVLLGVRPEKIQFDGIALTSFMRCLTNAAIT